MTLRRHILIFHQAALGDFVMTWPLAMALGRVFAQSRVSYVTGPDKGRLAEATLGVEWLGADNGWHTLFGPGEVPEDPVGKRLKSTQCVVLFAQNDEATFVDNVRRTAGDDIPIIVIRPNPPEGVHVMAHHLGQLREHGALGDYVEQMQTLLRTQGLAPRGRPAGQSVLIHPGSGSPAKNWPTESFIEVARQLKQGGADVRFVIGEVERERWPVSQINTLHDVCPLVEPSDLPTLRETLLAARSFIGNDSGPTHLAAALGLRTLALFGPASSVDQWTPVGPQVQVLPFNTTPAALASLCVAT